jgi:hypothetical protein
MPGIATKEGMSGLHPHVCLDQGDQGGERGSELYGSMRRDVDEGWSCLDRCYVHSQMLPEVIECCRGQGEVAATQVALGIHRAFQFDRQAKEGSC